MSFDANAFMNSVTTDVNATSLPPCPEGEYVGNITDVSLKDGIVKKEGSKNYNQPWYRLDFFVETFDPRALANLEGRTSRKVMAGVMLDIRDGKLSTGPDSNIQLGQLRAAAGLNVPGQAFSPSMLEGRTVKFIVKNETDQNDPTIVRSKAVGFKQP
jgi:hypothetical protein